MIAVFYAATFVGGRDPLRWICLGMALRVIAWPMGYILLAKGARALFFWTEVAATVVHVGLALVLVRLLRPVRRDDGVLRALCLAQRADLLHRASTDRIPLVAGQTSGSACCFFL